MKIEVLEIPRVDELISVAGDVRPAEVGFYDIDGRRLRVLRWRGKGPEQRPPLLFFSGIGSNAEILAPFMERFIDRDVITFDMPGIGGSAKKGGSYRFSTMAATANTILDELGYSQIDLMGVSWGGMMAQQIAHQYPARTRRLVLAATTAGLAMIPGRVSALTMMLNLRRFKDPGFLRRHFGTLYGGGNLGWDKYAAGVQSPTARGYLFQLAAMARWTSVGFLPDIKAKTLLLGATDDGLVRPINLHLLHSLIPGSDLRFIEGAGHMFLLSHLEEAVLNVAEFLNSSD
jgi:poly(3-hydroxyalkanoate) depolymerase